MWDHPELQRLDELFPRYWDGVLTPAEREEFEQILRDHETARQALLQMSMQAVTPEPRTSPPLRLPEPTPKRWSRRRLLGYASGGLALGLAGLLGWRHWRSEKFGTIRLDSVRGIVQVNRTHQVAAGQVVSPGSVLHAVGPGSSADLHLADGSTVSLTGDSYLGIESQRLLLHQGNASAQIQPQNSIQPIRLATPSVSVSCPEGASFTLNSASRVTEVGVRQGQASVSDSSGNFVDRVRAGEVLAMRSSGQYVKEMLTSPPTAYQLDLSQPLPQGWEVGYLETTPEGPAICPEFWFDPYHAAVLSQIRSNNLWTRGMVTLYPDSLIRVRYRVNRPGHGQLVIVVRTESRHRTDSGVIEVNDAFVHSRPGVWQWLEAHPRDMLDVKEAPKFGPPWVGFRLIFNTYELDLGLRIADFRVSRDGGV